MLPPHSGNRLNPEFFCAWYILTGIHTPKHINTHTYTPICNPQHTCLTDIHTSTLTYTNTHTYPHTHTYNSAGSLASFTAHLNTYAQTRTDLFNGLYNKVITLNTSHENAHTYTETHTHTYTHTHTHTCIHTLTRTHIHTHTHILAYKRTYRLFQWSLRQSRSSS